MLTRRLHFDIHDEIQQQPADPKAKYHRQPTPEKCLSPSSLRSVRFLDCLGAKSLLGTATITNCSFPRHISTVHNYLCPIHLVAVEHLENSL